MGTDAVFWDVLIGRRGKRKRMDLLGSVWELPGGISLDAREVSSVS